MRNFTHLFFIHFASAILQPTKEPSAEKVVCIHEKWQVMGTTKTYLKSSEYLLSICEEITTYDHYFYWFYAFEKK
jgi:hypothetical protein